MFETTLWILSIVIILIIIYSLTYNQVENFESTNATPFIVGYDEDQEPIYRIIDYNTNHPLYNYKNLNAMRFESRFPGLVKHRYSYNDKKETNEKDIDTSMYNFSFLKQLPQNIPRYHATVGEDIVALDPLLYYPDVSNSKPSRDNSCKESHQAYPYANKRGDPVLVDVKSDLFITKKEINGYDYDHMYDIVNNAGDGTSEFYHEIDKFNADH